MCATLFIDCVGLDDSALVEDAVFENTYPKHVCPDSIRDMIASNSKKYVLIALVKQIAVARTCQ